MSLSRMSLGTYKAIIGSATSILGTGLFNVSATNLGYSAIDPIEVVKIVAVSKFILWCAAANEDGRDDTRDFISQSAAHDKKMGWNKEIKLSRFFSEDVRVTAIENAISCSLGLAIFASLNLLNVNTLPFLAVTATSTLIESGVRSFSYFPVK